jgi:hypothetical protein
LDRRIAYSPDVPAKRIRFLAIDSDLTASGFLLCSIAGDGRVNVVRAETVRRRPMEELAARRKAIGEAARQWAKRAGREGHAVVNQDHGGLIRRGLLSTLSAKKIVTVRGVTWFQKLSVAATQSRRGTIAAYGRGLLAAAIKTGKWNAVLSEQLCVAAALAEWWTRNRIIHPFPEKTS